MDITEQQIIELIRNGEGLDLEFKTCRNQLNRDAYETVCAFLNRHGGTLLLGVQDNGVIQGIEPDAAAQIRKDFVTAINNPQKISPPTYLAVDEVTVGDKPLLRIYVPESSQVHRCNGRIYDRILAFVQRHLPDPFYLEGIERRSLRDHIFREVASNMLIHREYASGATSRLVIEYGRAVTDNPSLPHGFGRLDPATSVPFQKNPIIGRFFRQIDRADELGSDMRKMMLYGKKYGGADPELIEGDNFRMVISAPEFSENPVRTAKIIPTEQVTPEVRRMLTVISGDMTRGEIMHSLGLKDEKHFREHYQQIGIALGLIEMTIPDKPNSRLQKYRLTAKGQNRLKDLS